MPDPSDDGGPAELPEEMCGCAGRQRGGKEGQIQQVYRKRGVLRFQSCEQSSLGWVYTKGKTSCCNCQPLAQEIPVRAPSRWVPVLDRSKLSQPQHPPSKMGVTTTGRCLSGVEDED